MKRKNTVSRLGKLLIVLLVLSLYSCAEPKDSLNTPTTLTTPTTEKRSVYYGGVVVNSDTGQPIANAEVVLTISGEIPVSKYTDDRGVFKFFIPEDLPFLNEGDIGTGRLKVVVEGYEVSDENVVVSADNPATDKQVQLIQYKTPTPSPTPPGIVTYDVPPQPHELYLSQGGSIKRPEDMLTSVTIRQATKIGTWYLNHRVRRVSISEDGTMLAAGLYRPKISPHGLIYLWRIDEAERPQEIAHEIGGVDGLDFSTDGNYLAWSTWAYEVGAYDTGNRVRVLGVSGQSGSHSLAFVPNTYSIAVGFGGWVEIYTLNQVETSSLLNGVGTVTGIAFSSDGKYMAVASNDSGTITLIERSTGRLQEYDLGVRSRGISFSHNNKLIAAGGDDGTIKIWDRKTGDVVFETQVGGYISDVAFSFDGSMLAASTTQGEIMFFDIEQQIFIFALRESHPINSIAFSADGALLISGSQDGEVSIWAIAP